MDQTVCLPESNSVLPVSRTAAPFQLLKRAEVRTHLPRSLTLQPKDTPANPSNTPNAHSDSNNNSHSTAEPATVPIVKPENTEPVSPSDSGKIKILTPHVSPTASRQSPLASPESPQTSEVDVSPSAKTLKERREEYARARARIFNEELFYSSSDDEDDGEGNDSEKATDSLTKKSSADSLHTTTSSTANIAKKPFLAVPTNEQYGNEAAGVGTLSFSEPARRKQFARADETTSPYPPVPSRSAPSLHSSYPTYPVNNNNNRNHRQLHPVGNQVFRGGNPMAPPYVSRAQEEPHISAGSRSYVPNANHYPASGQNRMYGYYPVSPNAPVYLTHNTPLPPQNLPCYWSYNAYPGFPNIVMGSPGYVTGQQQYNETSFRQDPNTQ